MPQRFRYFDEFGRATEAEAFIVNDYSTTGGTPNTPIMTTSTGVISPSLLPQGVLKAAISHETFTLTEQNILDKKVTLQYEPIYPLNIMLMPEGGLTQKPLIDFEVVNGFEVSWDNKGLDGYVDVGERLEVIYYYNTIEDSINFAPIVEEIILTQNDISNGFILLENSPVFEESTIVIPDGSLPQTFGTSFTVDSVNKKIILGNLLPLLDADSTLTVMYYHL